MASNDEDTDLDALRSAVLASLKTRGRNDSSSCVTTEDEGSRNDAELEELRKAALQSKKLLDNENALQTSFHHASFPSISTFRRNLGFIKRSNRNDNLIVIEPVEGLNVYVTDSLPAVGSQSPGGNGEFGLRSQQPQRLKNSGKFSRFESGSESSDDNYDDDESQSSNETDDVEDDVDSNDEEHADDTSQEAVEENVLLLHPDEDLHETIALDDSIQQTTDAANSSEHRGAQCANKQGGKRRANESNGDSSRTARSSGRSIERPQRRDQVRRSIKENSDRRDRLERTRKRGEISERRSGDLKYDSSHKETHRTRQRDVGKNEAKRSEDRKEERRSKSDGDKSRRTTDRRHRSSAREGTISSILVSRRGSHERKQTAHSLAKDGCKTILRSRNSSPTKTTAAAAIDLREKLRLKKEQQDSKMEVCDNDGREGRTSPVVRSVLSVVAPTSLTYASADEYKSKSRSPMPISRERRAKLPRAVRRKSESPGRLGVVSPKTRKVVILSEKEKISAAKDTSKRVTDEVKATKESSPIQRIPVRQRLGVPPNNVAKSSSSSSTPKVRHSKSASIRKSKSPAVRVKQPSPPTEAIGDGSMDGGSDVPKRKVKLHRGTFASLIVTHAPSTSIKLQQELSSGDKSGRHKGLPTFENELDERIRRIQVNNEAILKRKYEIAWDRHRHK